MGWDVALFGLGLVLLVGIFMTGLPVFLCFILILTVALFVLFGPAGLAMFANSLYVTGTSESLVAVSLFVLMGELLVRSGTMEVLHDSVDALIGRVRGRQYILVMALSTVVGSLAGSAMAVAAMFGRSMLPTMAARGYDRPLAAGTIMAGALLAPIIPPSIVAVIIGMMAKVSIGDLLVAGILPGFLLAGLYFGAIFLAVWWNPKLAPVESGRDISWREWFGALGGLVPFHIVLLLVMGLLMLGVCTASESAAIGVVGSAGLAVWYRKISWRMLAESCAAATVLSCLVLIIVASATMFGQALAFTGVMQKLGVAVTSLEMNRWLLFFLMMLLPFILCMFVDQVGVMLVLIPIYDPILKTLGFDAVWFWTLFMINLVLGSITPPFGYVLFALKAAVPSMPMTEIYGAAWGAVLVTLLGMLIMTIFPSIVTVLPNLTP